MSHLRSFTLGLTASFLVVPAYSAPPDPTSQENLISPAKLMNSQVWKCWLPDMKSHEIVTLDVHLNRDGTLAQPPTLDLTNIGSDLPSPGAVTAAIRAVEHCAPYKLPPDQYENWKDQKLTFDPPYPRD